MMVADADDETSQLEQLLDTPDLAAALESDRFKQFLDHLPIGIAVSELGQGERITYAKGFDGFAMFTRDGKHIVWCSNRNGSYEGNTNIFIADWTD